MDQQSDRIAQLEFQLKSAENSPYVMVNRMNDKVDTLLKAFDERMTFLDEKVLVLQRTADLVNLHQQKIAGCEKLLTEKADLSELALTKGELQEEMDKNFTHLQSNKASISTVASLEESQHRILEEVVALQRLTACKVDRVEMPLLAAAVERMQKLITFQEETVPRLGKIEETLLTTSRIMSQKEDKEAMVQRMQNIHEELLRRPDMHWVEKEVMEPMQHVQKQANLIAQHDDMLRKTEAVLSDAHREIGNLNTGVGQIASTVSALEQVNQEVIEQLATKATKEFVAARMDEKSVSFESWVKHSSEKLSADSKIQAAYIAEVRSQVTELRRYHNTMEKKIGVALKFIDWFTDVKLKGATDYL